MYSLMICSKKSSHCETAGVASLAGVFVVGSRCVVLLCQDTGEIVSAVFVAAYLCINCSSSTSCQCVPMCVCEACVLTQIGCCTDVNNLVVIN
jgi:hypothetical protein